MATDALNFGDLALDRLRLAGPHSLQSRHEPLPRLRGGHRELLQKYQGAARLPLLGARCPETPSRAPCGQG